MQKPTSSNQSMRLALVAVMLGAAASTPSQATPFAHDLSVFTAAIEKAAAPIGWSAFCARHAAECTKASPVQTLAATASIAVEPAISVNWYGSNNKAIANLQEWPLGGVWPVAGQQPDQAPAQFAYANISFDVMTLFAPYAEDENPEIGMTESPARPSTAPAPRKIELTAENLEILARVNSQVNREIKPVPDRQHFGRPNVWVYPTDGKGDCKAYTLVKQRKLIQAGFPREALLITVVWTKEDQGHAVLMARTDKGDYILDNLSSKVMLWTETTHDYVKRQSISDPNAWVYIDGYRNPKQKIQVATLANE